MWRPGFDYIEAVDGRLYGYNRALCVSSWLHRGTPRVNKTSNWSPSNVH